MRLFTGLLCLLPGGTGQVWGAEPAAQPSCGPAVVAPAPRTPLPAGVSGRVSFYAALYDAHSGQVIRELALGHVGELHPLASLYKPLVVRAALEDVDAGRLSLVSGLATTPATRSIEIFPPGVNSVERLVRRAIVQSDNTASDLLQLAHGSGRLAREVWARSPCTAVLLTTKAWWSAQAGLAPGVLGRDRVAGARRYGRLPSEERVAAASRLIAASRQVSGPGLEAALERFFHGPEYRPELELNLQNTGTARAYTELMQRTLSGAGMRPGTRRLLREVMSRGCCKPAAPVLRASYWASKAGSGWRILNLTGYAELPGGVTLAYTYLNDGSRTTESEDMERQIPGVVRWIELSLLELSAPRPGARS